MCCLLFQILTQPAYERSDGDGYMGRRIRRRHSYDQNNAHEEVPRVARAASTPSSDAPVQLLNARDIYHREHSPPFPEPDELIRPDEYREELWQLRLVAATVVDPTNEDRHLLSTSELIQFFGAPGARWLLYRMGRTDDITAVDNWLHLHPTHPSAATGPLAHLAEQPPHPSWYDILVPAPESNPHPWVLDIPERFFDDNKPWSPGAPPAVLRHVPMLRTMEIEP